MSRWKTALFGFGKIGAGLAEDPVHALAYPYATHAQVLRDHPEFDWVGVVDSDPIACAVARDTWGVSESVVSVCELPSAASIDVAVIAIPPDSRPAILDGLPNLRAVLVEKPLAEDLEAAEGFLAHCAERGVAVTVALPRRYDKSLRELAAGGLVRRIGKPMAVFATYGNGLANNGTHLIDLVRLLLGEIVSTQAVMGAAFAEGPISGDINLPFVCTLDSGVAAMISPLRFSCYREVGLDIWGETGRLQILHESLTMIFTPRDRSRILTDAAEIAHDAPVLEVSTVGHALYAVYDNLAAVMRGEPAFCAGPDALVAMRIVDAVRRSADCGGSVIACGSR